MKALISLLVLFVAFNSFALDVKTSEPIRVEETATEVTFQVNFRILNAERLMKPDFVSLVSNKADIQFFAGGRDVITHITFNKTKVFKAKKGDKTDILKRKAWLVFYPYGEPDPIIQMAPAVPFMTPPEIHSFSWDLLLEYDPATVQSKMSLVRR